MKHSTFLTIVYIACLIVLVVTIGSYLVKFHSSSISNDPAVWGQFGDYVGGVLNPILTLLNLVVLAYLSFKLVEIESKRNEWTLQELARPLGDLTFLTFQDQYEIQLKNCGLGPMLISNIKIMSTDGQEYTNFADIIKPIPVGVEYSFYHHTDIFATLGKDAEVSLMRIQGRKEDKVFTDFMAEMRSKIKGWRIEISYCDIYKRPIDKINLKIES